MCVFFVERGTNDVMEGIGGGEKERKREKEKKKRKRERKEKKEQREKKERFTTCQGLETKKTKN